MVYYKQLYFVNTNVKTNSTKDNFETKFIHQTVLIIRKINIPYNRTSNKRLKMLKPFSYVILYCTTNQEYTITTRLSSMHPIPLKIKSVVKKR